MHRAENRFFIKADADLETSLGKKCFLLTGVISFVNWFRSLSEHLIHSSIGSGR
jgi:hypothetical protein